ncbi:trypsin-like serine proteases [Candidatus Scalindua japonica]|uniref:Trypsin-like serine proteases n=1 Tax=Candidatus Scalindua japonica TaxID=1284222 RepID=A0A286U2F8_9BACT|nr:trypsin-like peptidase domain-containing protein [Candidatus Scalindua japonica]GAX62312.1 trypsin-like serine proteases [Candidatus Scalindua japonica]
MQNDTFTNPKMVKLARVLIIIVIVWIVADFFGIKPTSFFQPKVAIRPVTQPVGELGADERVNMEVFAQSSPSVTYITNKRFQRDFFSFNVMEIPQGTGSGFLWDSKGHIVTNFHVIYEADEIEVKLMDGKTYDATIVGADPDHDLAVLQINPANLNISPLMIGSSSDLRVGQKVLAIGNPFGLDSTLTTGIISALDRTIQSMTKRYIYDVVQTDAAINPGNSGGPLLDSFGRLIGVNTAIISPSGTYSGVGFAVPVDTVNRVVTKLINYGKVGRPGFGISIIPEHIMSRLGIEGVGILEVFKGSTAEEAGLREVKRLPNGQIEMGDIIIEVDGSKVSKSSDLVRIMDRHDVGDEVDIVIIRNGVRKSLRIAVQSIN